MAAVWPFDGCRSHFVLHMHHINREFGEGVICIPCAHAGLAYLNGVERHSVGWDGLRTCLGNEHGVVACLPCL